MLILHRSSSFTIAERKKSFEAMNTRLSCDSRKGSQHSAQDSIASTVKSFNCNRRNSKAEAAATTVQEAAAAADTESSRRSSIVQGCEQADKPKWSTDKKYSRTSSKERPKELPIGQTDKKSVASASGKSPAGSTSIRELTEKWEQAATPSTTVGSPAPSLPTPSTTFSRRSTQDTLVMSPVGKHASLTCSIYSKIF